MAIEVDHNKAFGLLARLTEEIRENPVNDCGIADTIDATLKGEGCMTYQYILLTALTAKATNPDADILSLHTTDPSPGSYAARSLCKVVIYPYQRDELGDPLNGSNEDPYVNKPARYPRLTTGNAARGDGRRVLELLCRDLPKIETSQDAEQALSYLLTQLDRVGKSKREAKLAALASAETLNEASLHGILADLLEQGFGGSSLVLVASAILKLRYRDTEGIDVKAHPASQPGVSRAQTGDIDVLMDGEPLLSVELKDRAFSRADVTKAIETASNSGAQKVLFISGDPAEYPPGYLEDVREYARDRGMYAGVVDIAALMDVVLATGTQNINVPEITKDIISTASEIRCSTEALMWIYQRVKTAEREMRP